MKRTIVIGGAIAAALIIGTGSGAYAAGLVGSAGIKNDSVRSIDVKDGTLRVRDLRPTAIEKLRGHAGKNGVDGKDGAKGDQGEKGDKGAKGDAGDSYLAGAYYSVAFYDVGDTNAGAIATVACSAQADTAISGGVQVLGLDAGANNRNTPVSSSFPGRMDWSTNSPKADRLDGWIVQFGGNAGASSDKAPEKVKVWALCVPGLDIPVNQTYTQSG